MKKGTPLSRRRILQLGAGALAVPLVGCGAGLESQKGLTGKLRELADGPADLILTGGTVFTGDPATPLAEAVAVRGGRVVAVGERQHIERLRGPQAMVLDLGGGAATPGLVDAHGHVVSLGASLEKVDLRGAESIAEVIHRIRTKAPQGKWIIGRSWDQNRWPDKKMPSHQPLTEAFGDRPVWLTRVDGHAGWGNAALLKAAGITSETKDPQGGEILRDAQGHPTGVLIDAAMNLVPVPESSAEDTERHILSAQQHLIERGITGVHDMGVGRQADRTYRELGASADPQRQLSIRVCGYAAKDWFFEELVSRQPDQWQPDGVYALTGLKLFADGALGSRGALMLEPYADRPGHLGLAIHTQQELNEMCAKAAAGKWQVTTHAIGDGANRAVLDAYAHALAAHPMEDHRFRVEHCQIMDLADIPRFAELGIIASMQPTHATSDMPWVPTRVGKSRVAGAYAWRRFLETGAHLALGSDFPVEHADITFGIHAAVTRQDSKGNPPDGWLPDQKLTLEEAIAGFSAGAAFAGRQDQFLGRLSPGFQADITCFTKNIFDISHAELRHTPIRATIVRGNVLYSV